MKGNEFFFFLQDRSMGNAIKFKCDERIKFDNLARLDSDQIRQSFDFDRWGNNFFRDRKIAMNLALNN